MISGDELKYRNGLAGFLSLGIAPPYPIRRVPLAGAFALTGPNAVQCTLFMAERVGFEPTIRF